MRTLRFHEYGSPLEVVRLDEAEIPTPGPGQIRIAVQACGLNPADWALCDGLFAGALPAASASRCPASSMRSAPA
ncbi:hypothetical protein [Nocardia sp. NRRL WC-3656]|uniref:hypothetical protein n=1 Tax=Nocardia sp. NRRL WC-3656 TaxID=1463824 RepID=UPI000B0D85F1|nr:hypothetical protein [Nocardia sp. NRRL WC-3656]